MLIFEVQTESHLRYMNFGFNKLKHWREYIAALGELDPAFTLVAYGINDVNAISFLMLASMAQFLLKSDRSSPSFTQIGPTKIWVIKY